MGLSREGGAHRCVAGLESVQRPGTLRQEIFGGAVGAYVLEDRVAARSSRL